MSPANPTHRPVHALLLVTLMLLSGSALADGPVLKRKNIDSLTTEELNAYMHALEILKKRSEDDRYDFSGFTWQADVHNTDQVKLPDGTPAYPGRCEHGNDLFLPWHRAELYFFEKILQQTDPDGESGPATKNVTVPYWNWTRPPSGRRYPRVFEDSEQYPVLFHSGRNTGRVTAVPGYAQPTLIGALLDEPNWNVFAGGKKENGGGFGTFEAQSHNPMHSRYIGGDMGDPTRAARDPIFYSFHCYIDLIYEEWLNRHGLAGHTSGNFYLRGTQPEDVPRPAGYVAPQLGPERVMGQVKLYYDTSKLNYVYEVLPADQFLKSRDVEDVLSPLRDRPVFASNSASRESLLRDNGLKEPLAPPDIVRAKSFSVPEAGSKSRVSVKLNLAKEPVTVSYQVDVYLHPSDTEYEPQNRSFQKRYLVSSFSRWEGGHHQMHGNSRPIQIDISDEVNSLIPSHAGEKWTVTFAIRWLPLKDGFKDIDVSVEPAA